MQASCHGTDNSALIDALISAEDTARGVAIVSPDISDDELHEMDAAGVRAVRFNFLKRLVDVTPKEEFLRIAERVAELDWHIVVYFEIQDLEELTPFLQSLPTVVVVDHMGRPNISGGIEHPDFERFTKLLDYNENFWTKVSCPERLTLDGPPYDDVIPFARYLVENFPERTLWGTDWPHPNMKSHIPDDGLLTDTIPRIATSEHARNVLLVDNPARLYWNNVE